MSLSGFFDNTNPSDLLKSLLNILTEYEQSKEENYKPKMVSKVYLTFLKNPIISFQFGRDRSSIGTKCLDEELMQ